MRVLAGLGNICIVKPDRAVKIVQRLRLAYQMFASSGGDLNAKVGITPEFQNRAALGAYDKPIGLVL